MKTVDVWSVGHSNVDIETFVSRIQPHDIEVIVDVRTVPFSRYTPHFNQENLKLYLKKEGIDYQFMGESLGGRPPEVDYYDAEGHVLYRPLSKNFRFMRGLEDLCVVAESKRTAMMCSEESPENCHRRLLIGRVLRDQGIDVLHIHGDKSVLLDSALKEKFGPHDVVTLFGVEEDAWRSIRPVLQNGRQKRSSDD